MIGVHFGQIHLLDSGDYVCKLHVLFFCCQNDLAQGHLNLASAPPPQIFLISSKSEALHTAFMAKGSQSATVCEQAIGTRTGPESGLHTWDWRARVLGSACAALRLAGIPFPFCFSVCLFPPPPLHWNETTLIAGSDARLGAETEKRGGGGEGRRQKGMKEKSQRKYQMDMGRDRPQDRDERSRKCWKTTSLLQIYDRT